MSHRDTPGWRRAFDTVERRIGGPIESAMNAPDLYSILAIARRTQRVVATRVDQLTSCALHQIGVPSARDIRRLRGQVSALQQELGALRRELTSVPFFSEGMQ
jgi:hypothetical protein